jgi:hypothetical protein
MDMENTRFSYPDGKRRKTNTQFKVSKQQHSTKGKHKTTMYKMAGHPLLSLLQLTRQPERRRRGARRRAMTLKSGGRRDRRKGKMNLPAKRCKMLVAYKIR